MPLVNYCRKCKAETPVGESCPRCGAKLMKTGERISFGVVRTPLRDWFEWNRALRIGLPVLLLVLGAALAAEAAAGGAAAVEALFAQGFAETMLGLLAALLLVCLLSLWLQGDEKVRYLLDRDGVRAYTYLQEPSDVQLYARFLSPASARALAGDEHAIEGLTLVRRVVLPWSQVRRVRVVKENATLLFFRPKYWQALAVRCPPQELEAAEALVRAKLKRFPKAAVYPLQKPKKK